jgi:hypothetical protein
MTDVLAELDAVALDFPSAVFRRSKFVLISVVALLQAASERPCFLWVVFVVSCAAANPAVPANRKQRSKCHRHLHFHPYLRNLDLQSVKQTCNSASQLLFEPAA